MTSILTRRLILIISAAVIGLLLLDINDHGSFKASKTGTFLKDSGALHYGVITWSYFRSYSQQAYRWCQKNVPVYITKVREWAVPHLQIILVWLTSLAQKLWANVKLLYGYFLEKKPVFEKWINQYTPGMIDVVSSSLCQVWTFLRDNIILLLKSLSVAGWWLTEKVFIGSISPKNLQRYTMDVINTTQQLALHTFSWVSDKVVTVIYAS